MPRKLAARAFQGLPLVTLEGPFVNYLRDGNKSQNTIDQYLWAVRRLAGFLSERGRSTVASEITPDDVSAFQRHLLDTRSPATADAAHRSLKVFFAWAERDGEIQANPIAKLTRPRQPVKPVDIIPPEDARALFATCKGISFEDLRDLSVLLLLWDSGARRAEIAGLRCEDVHFESNTATVVGKGAKTRNIPFTAKTARQLRKYMTQARPRHPDAYMRNLWLGANGAMTSDGIRHILDRRCEEAGLAHIHPHQFRHTLAHRYLANGGNQNNLMLLMGWSSPQMVARYVQSTATELAIGEYQRLGLDEF